MLTLVVDGAELFDERNSEFINLPPQILRLEHSLVAISAWESKWCKPFLSKEAKTTEETIHYIQCMTVTPDDTPVDPSVYARLTNDHFAKIKDYIEAPMTATTFSKDPSGKTNKEIVTSELIYYWMVALNIPLECEHWHLNRLLTLIRVCNIKNEPPKKMSKKDVMAHNKALNEARRKQLGMKG